MTRLATLLAVVASCATLSPAQQNAQPEPVTDAGRRYEALARAAGGPAAKDSDNGWPTLMAVVEVINRAAPVDGRGPHAGADLTVLREGGQGPERDKAIAALNALKSAGLFEKVDSLKSVKWISRPAQGGRVVKWMLPELGALRQAARALAAESRLAADAGDWPQAARMVEGELALSRLLTQDPILISHLVGLAVASLAQSDVSRLVLDGRLNPSALKLFEEAMDRQMPLPPIAPAFEGERIGGMDALDLAYTTKGKTPSQALQELQVAQGDQPAPAEPGAGGEVPPRQESETKLNGYYARLVRIAAEPGAAALRDATALDNEIKQLPAGATVVGLIMPASMRAMQSRLRTDAYLRGTRLMLALERRRADKGQYPATLAELGAIADLKDPYTDKPFMYRKLAGNTANDGYLLWSTGADGVDDNGKFEQWEPARAARADAAGIDLVINAPDIVARSGGGK